MGGAHYKPERARCFLRQALRLWEALPLEARNLQHRMVIQVFADGPLRCDLDACLEIEDDMVNHALLFDFMVPLRFVQVVERILEAAHRALNVEAANVGHNIISLVLRAQELTRSLALREDVILDLVQGFDCARRIRICSRNFRGHVGHPFLRK